MQCPACATEIAPGGTFCPTCRARGQGQAPVATPAPRVMPVAPPPRFQDRHERLYLVIACLFAAGALAIPRLRRSDAFGPGAKTVLTGCALLNTIGAVALLGVLVIWGPKLALEWMHLLQRGF